MLTTRLRFLTAGESHGPSLTGVLEGMPAGVPLDEDRIATQLARRQQGLGAGGRMKIERDRARITAGVMAGRHDLEKNSWHRIGAAGHTGARAASDMRAELLQRVCVFGSQERERR